MITQPRSSSLTGASLLIAATVFAAVIPTYFNLKTESAARQQAAQQVDRAVTLAEYEQIRPGLSQVQVRSLLGRSGREVGRIAAPDALTTLYIWQNPDGSHLSVTFRDEIVVTKAQSRLY